jgi:hypothetical protein
MEIHFSMKINSMNSMRGIRMSKQLLYLIHITGYRLWGRLFQDGVRRVL